MHMERVEMALDLALADAGGPSCPPLLASALRYAVFPGGHRIRPQIVLAVAMACGDPNPKHTDAAAAAIEFMHCASLVHDDLPTFDDAPIRRGKPTVHVEFGEPLAVLTGDALIVLAYETIARAFSADPRQLCDMINIVSRSVGAPGGIIAGQAWESEASDLAGRLSARQDRRPVRRRDPCRRRRRRPRPRTLARARRRDRRGLSGRGRSARSALRRRGARQAHPPGRAPARPNAAAQLGIGGAKARLTASPKRGRVDPRLPGRRTIAGGDPRANAGAVPFPTRTIRGLTCPAPTFLFPPPSGRRPFPSRSAAPWAQPPDRQSLVSALGRQLSADAPDRGAAIRRPVRSVLGIRLFAGAARLRPARPVHQAGQRSAVVRRARG